MISNPTPRFYKMTPEWKIQDNFVDIEKALNLKNSCDKLGIPASGISVMPFIETLEPLEKGNYIFSGSTKLVRLAYKEQYGGIWFHPENFDFHRWHERLGSFMLNKQLCDDITLEDLSKSTIENVFIRPRYDLKPFASGYVDQAKEWAASQMGLAPNRITMAPRKRKPRKRPKSTSISAKPSGFDKNIKGAVSPETAPFLYV